MPEVESTDGFEKLRIDRSRRTARRPTVRIGLVAGLLLVVGLTSLVLLGRPPLVAVAQVREARPGETVTQLTAAGYVDSERRSTIAPKIPGKLVEVAVKEGEHVDEGEVLARLDDADARAALQQAQAQTRAAEAQAGGARAVRAKAKRDLDQMSRLAEAGAVSRTALLDAESQARSASAGEQSALAQVRAAEDAAEQARIRLDSTVVRAPFAGTVSKKLADEGAVLAPAAVSDVNVGGIVELVDLGALNVEAELSEDRLSSVHEGQPALIFLDAYPDKFFEGEAGTIRPTIDRAKATAVVKVPFLVPPEGVFPNMGAKVSFLSRRLDADALAHEPRLRVPRSSVVKVNGGDAVFVVAGERLKVEPVEVSIVAGDEVALARGPAPGSQVVAAPTPKLHDGQRVRVAAGAT
jgi:RND family efflux transporter MFP subunit